MENLIKFKISFLKIDGISNEILFIKSIYYLARFNQQQNSILINTKPIFLYNLKKNHNPNYPKTKKSSKI